MTAAHDQEPKSLLIFLFDKNLQARHQFALPMSVAAPAINRILREVLPEKLASIKEPWYRLVPHCVHEELTLNRAPIPEGESSLSGDRYVAEKEPPPRVTHHPEPHVEFFTVIIKDYQKEIFRGQFSVDDLFHAGAEFLARKQLEQGDWTTDDEPYYYKVEVSQDYIASIQQDLFPDEAYEVENAFQLPKRETQRKRIAFKRVPSPPLETTQRADFGESVRMGRGKKFGGTVLMHSQVYRDLLEITLSEKVENGGYLLGVPHRNLRSPKSEDDPKFKWTIEITDIIQAHGAHGSPGLLLFNGDCWSEMRRTASRDHPDKKLVSWFHTHLFAASDDFGLSGLDQDLHRQFFPKPWQVAILINIDAQSEREVRCFQRGPEGDLVECRFEVLKEQE